MPDPFPDGLVAYSQRAAMDLLRRDLNTISSTWQEQFDAAFKALEVTNKDIAVVKKARNKLVDVSVESPRLLKKS